MKNSTYLALKFTFQLYQIRVVKLKSSPGWVIEDIADVFKIAKEDFLQEIPTYAVKEQQIVSEKSEGCLEISKNLILDDESFWEWLLSQPRTPQQDWLIDLIYPSLIAVNFYPKITVRNTFLKETLDKEDKALSVEINV